MSADERVTEITTKMHKAVDHLRDEFSTLRTGRANPALVERIRVEYFGSEVPLQQLASFSVPEPRVLVVSPYDKSALKAIEKAVQSSDLGVNPGNDGNVIRLVFPELTEQRRKEYVKLAKAKAEEARVGVRNVRRSARQELEGHNKSGDISDDDLARVEKELDKATQSVIAEVDKLLDAKEKELLEV